MQKGDQHDTIRNTMNTVSNCPMRATSFVWRPGVDRWAQTVVCRATYRLAPTESPLAEEQEEPNEYDNHWNDDETRSLYAPSDLVPFKKGADVLLVGHAFAPRRQPVHSIIARLTVGEMSKAVEVWCDRGFEPARGLLVGQRLAKMPLRYERAAGGPETSNPVGMRFDGPPDAYGMTAIPNLQPEGLHVTQRGDTFPPIGFGPIAPSWPGRMDKLCRHAAGWSHRDWREQPMPNDIDPGYFNAAPPDQQVDSLRPNERILMENLHPDHARLVTSLPNVQPRATAEVEGRGREDVVLVCDTLWIDTDRGLCALVWRGTIALVHPNQAGRIVITMETAGPAGPGKPPPPPSRAKAPPAASPRPPNWPAPPSAEVPIENNASGIETITIVPALDRSSAAARAPVIPFSGAPAEAPDPGRGQASGLPFVRSPDVSAPPVMAPPPVVAPPPIVAPPPVVESLGPVAASSPWALSAPLVSKAGSGLPQMVSPGSLSAKPLIPGGTDGAKSGAQAASDAAAKAEDALVGRELMGAKVSGAAAFGARFAVMQRGPVEFLWVNAGSLARIRKQEAWKSILAEVKPKPEDEDLEDDVPPPRRTPAKDRRDMLAILSRGEALDVEGVEAALLRATDDEGGFTPPLVVVGGELELQFDELETLKATLAAVSPHAAGDEKLKKVVDATTELFKAPWAQGANGVMEELAKQLRDVFLQGSKERTAVYLDQHVERTLLDHRHFQKRTVLGQLRLRCLLSGGVSSARVPAYLPESLGKELPAFRRFGVRMIAEVRPRLEQSDAHPAALRVVAMGRIIT